MGLRPGASAVDRTATLAASFSTMGTLLRTTSAGVGVLANVLVLAAVLLFGLGWYDLLLVYYLEILLIGGYNFMKIMVAGLLGDPLGRFVDHSNRLAVNFVLALVVGFFLVKFGAVVLGMGLFFVMVPGLLAEPGAREGAVWAALSGLSGGIILCVGILGLSHFASFVLDYLGRREYRVASLLPLLVTPYLRLFGIFGAVVVALAAATARDGPARVGVFVAVLFMAKVAADLVAHGVEHGFRAARTPSASPGMVVSGGVSVP